MRRRSMEPTPISRSGAAMVAERHGSTEAAECLTRRRTARPRGGERQMRRGPISGLLEQMAQISPVGRDSYLR